MGLRGAAGEEPAGGEVAQEEVQAVEEAELKQNREQVHQGWSQCSPHRLSRGEAKTIIEV